MNKVFNLTIAKDGTVYAAGDQKGAVLYVSQDQGKSWKFLNRFADEGAVTGICLAGQNANKIAIGTTKWHGKNEGLVYVSEDGGIHWKDYTGNLPLSAGISAMAYSSKEGCLYVSESASSVYKIKWS